MAEPLDVVSAIAALVDVSFRVVTIAAQSVTRPGNIYHSIRRAIREAREGNEDEWLPIDQLFATLNDRDAAWPNMSSVPISRFHGIPSTWSDGTSKVTVHEGVTGLHSNYTTGFMSLLCGQSCRLESFELLDRPDSERNLGGNDYIRINRALNFSKRNELGTAILI